VTSLADPVIVHVTGIQYDASMIISYLDALATRTPGVPPMPRRAVENVRLVLKPGLRDRSHPNALWPQITLTLLNLAEIFVSHRCAITESTYFEKYGPVITDATVFEDVRRALYNYDLSLAILEGNFHETGDRTLSHECAMQLRNFLSSLRSLCDSVRAHVQECPPQIPAGPPVRPAYRQPLIPNTGG